MARPLWRKAPLALRHFPSAAAAIMAGSLLATIVVATFPVMLSGSPCRLLGREVANSTVSRYGAGILFSVADVPFNKQAPGSDQLLYQHHGRRGADRPTRFPPSTSCRRRAAGTGRNEPRPAWQPRCRCASGPTTSRDRSGPPAAPRQRSFSWSAPSRLSAGGTATRSSARSQSSTPGPAPGITSPPAPVATTPAPAPHRVPDVVGLSLHRAFSVLTRAGAQMGQLYANVSEQPHLTVLQQGLNPGSVSNAHRVVDLLVSAGPHPIGRFITAPCIPRAQNCGGPGAPVPIQRGPLVTLLGTPGHGALPWCPTMKRVLPITAAVKGKIGPVALRFANSYLTGQHANVQFLSDPSARGRPRSVWRISGTPQALEIIRQGSSADGAVVIRDCGRRVAERSWFVVMRSGRTGSPFTLFMIRHREAFTDTWSERWKVWGSAAGVLQLRNMTTSTCMVRGVPAVHLLSPAGKPLDVPVIGAPDGPVPGAGRRRVILLPGRVASATFEWTNWCGRHLDHALARVGVPGEGGTLVARPSPDDFLVPTCEAPGRPSGAYVGGLYPGPVGTLAFPLSAVKPVVQAPGTVVAGTDLRYRVVLTNVTGLPVPLAPCPTYRATLVTASGLVVRRYRLSCASVGSIRPHASVTFAMVLHVPRTAPPGQARLAWTVEGSGSSGQAEVVVQ